MERKIGETFEYEGKTLKVKEDKNGSCHDCFFNKKCTLPVIKIVGKCDAGGREDNKGVVFVEVQEQTQETEKIKEREVGEVFEYQGKKLKVVETADNLCFGCYFFDGVNCQRTEREGGECSDSKRADYKPVIFVEVKDEQPQELNLCEILKDCPKGEKFWSPMLGAVKLHDIIQSGDIIIIEAKNRETWEINPDGTMNIGDIISPEIMLYPSKEQRDWTKVKYEKKKERFDPKTLKPFDKVVVSNIQNNTWHIEYFSHIEERCKPYPFYCLADNFAYCIPYNDETKHLVGTTDEAPDFYRYWEE